MYKLCWETDDGSIEPAFATFTRKDWAVSAARKIAKSGVYVTDWVRLIVENAEGLTVASFPTRHVG